MMATISELWESFLQFQESDLYLDPDESYTLTLWADGEGELINNEWVQVTRWETFDEGVEKLNELTGLNKAAQNG